jgi:hypothetical protein
MTTRRAKLLSYPLEQPTSCIDAVSTSSILSTKKSPLEHSGSYWNEAVRCNTVNTSFESDPSICSSGLMGLLMYIGGARAVTYNDDCDMGAAIQVALQT